MNTREHELDHIEILERSLKQFPIFQTPGCPAGRADYLARIEELEQSTPTLKRSRVLNEQIMSMWASMTPVEFYYYWYCYIDDGRCQGITKTGEPCQAGASHLEDRGFKAGIHDRCFHHRLASPITTLPKSLVRYPEEWHYWIIESEVARGSGGFVGTLALVTHSSFPTEEEIIKAWETYGCSDVLQINFCNQIDSLLYSIAKDLSIIDSLTYNRHFQGCCEDPVDVLKKANASSHPIQETP
ncbi:MAG: hypothetical protein HUJ26_18875 [Planctomycetaceae bacterium]|nr:hypothetical protein [Planctomycetaceae bacterium]